MATLVFIDTNILLAFYRIRSRDAGLSILRKLEQHKDLVITTDQLVMEFKKNRQKVLLETHKNFKAPDWASLTLPPLLTETKASRALESHKKALAKHSQKLKARLEKVVKEPSRFDPVYQALQRIWKHPSAYRLFRDKKVRLEVRDAAQKRFTLGYPPRKDSDTSYGDAINWEWIVRCATESGCGIVIVTRDGDYGATVDGKPVLNDWLREEFRERVSKRRRIVVTDRITEGLKQLSVRVTQQEDEATENLAASVTSLPSGSRDELRSSLFSLLGIAGGALQPSLPQIGGLLSLMGEKSVGDT